MARKLIQDIFVKGKATDISPIRPDTKDAMQDAPAPRMPASDISAKRQSFKELFPERRKRNFEEPRETYEDEEKISKNSHVFIWIVCIVALGTFLFFASSLFATATITITPKSEPVALNDTYTITQGTSTDPSALDYQIVSLTQTLSQPLVTNGDQNVAEKATGKAIIYNDYSAATQELIVNTRLETTAGLVYRITKTVYVPGIKTVNGVKTPGSIAVDIVADQPGSQYNMALADLKGDFTIPGFQGTPQYNGFYARLSADAEGGYIGSAKTVSADVLSAGKAQLESNLQTELIKDIYSQNATDSTIFKNNYFIEYSDMPDVTNATSYTISESATIYAVSFNEEALAAFIAKNKLGDYDGSAVDAIWNDDISVTVTGATASPWTESSLQAIFSGDATIVWSYDSSKILDEIKGQDRSVLQSVASEYKASIANITGSITPPWDSSFPKNTDKIKIVDSVRGAAM